MRVAEKQEYLTLRIPKKLKKQLQEKAESEDRSLSNLAYRLLLKGVAAEMKVS